MDVGAKILCGNLAGPNFGSVSASGPKHSKAMETCVNFAAKAFIRRRYTTMRKANGRAQALIELEGSSRFRDRSTHDSLSLHQAIPHSIINRCWESKKSFAQRLPICTSWPLEAVILDNIITSTAQRCSLQRVVRSKQECSPMKRFCRFLNKTVLLS
jgi:hypothetical protein